jgi:hypothetical protein
MEGSMPVGNSSPVAKPGSRLRELGLGSYDANDLTPEDIMKVAAEIRQLTDKPFGRFLCSLLLFFGSNCSSCSTIFVKLLRNHRSLPKQEWLRVFFGTGESMKLVTKFLVSIVATGIALTASAQSDSKCRSEPE